MALGELLREKVRGGRGAYRWFADEPLANALPSLGITRMTEEARSRFREILAIEKPCTDDALEDCLALAEARGFCADPRDYLPDFKVPARHLPLYQPWVDWLSEHQFTPQHPGNTLTAENWPKWTPGAMASAFTALARRNRQAAYDLVFNHCTEMPVGHRAALLQSLNAGGSFSGCYPWQVPMIRYFLNDRTAKVRDMARAKLDAMEGLETEESHAQFLAQHLTVENGRIRYKIRQEPHSSPFWRHWHSTSIAALADALRLTPVQLAYGAEIDYLDWQFKWLAHQTGSIEVRTIMARRSLAMTDGKSSFVEMRDLDRKLWERGLEAVFQSHYWNTVQRYLGSERGYLTPAQMHRMSAFQSLVSSVTLQLKKRKLPVNICYDPLRVVAFSVGKEAAGEALEQALALGMKPDDRRLTMLYFNLAL